MEDEWRMVKITSKEEERKNERKHSPTTRKPIPNHKKRRDITNQERSEPFPLNCGNENRAMPSTTSRWNNGIYVEKNGLFPV